MAKVRPQGSPACSFELCGDSSRLPAYSAVGQDISGSGELLCPLATTKTGHDASVASGVANRGDGVVVDSMNVRKAEAEADH